MSTPEIEDFIAGVESEAAYQREHWGEEHDAQKEPQDWFWLVGYLAGKALRAHLDGDADKARHHTISSAAVLKQWHQRITDDAEVDAMENAHIDHQVDAADAAMRTT